MRLITVIDAPVAYVEIVESEDREPKDSVTQQVVDISNSKLGFTPTELIFDLDKDGRILGVELL